MTLTCTHGPSAVTGERCGAPAVTSFTGAHGETFAECAEHAVVIARSTPGTVTVRRNGRFYTGRVVHVTLGGIVYAEITYENGVVRKVRV